MDNTLPDAHNALGMDHLVSDSDADNVPQPSPLFWDRLAVLAQLSGFYRQGLITLEVLEAWKQHVADNQSDSVADCPNGVCNKVVVEADDNRQRLLRGAVARFMERNPVRVRETLGEQFRAVIFTGPRVNTLVFSAEAARDTVDLAFQSMEFFMHYASGHVKGGTYDFMPEFRRDRPIPMQYLTPRFGDLEDRARKTTCCLWDDAYSESVLEHSLLRSAIRQPGVTKQVFRAAVANKRSFRTSLLHHFADSPIGVVMRSRIHVPPVYGGPIAVVKAPDNVDINVYILQRVRRPGEERDVVCRRWIPSQTVLHHLGLSTDDVVRIPWDQLMSYEEEAILIHPAEVAALRSVIENTVMYAVANLLLSAESRLRGVSRRVLEPDASALDSNKPKWRIPSLSHLVNQGRDAVVNGLLESGLGIMLSMAPGWSGENASGSYVPLPKRIPSFVRITPR